MTLSAQRTSSIVWFLLGAVPALLVGLVLGPLVSHLIVARSITTAEIITLTACLIVGLLGAAGGWFAANAFQRRFLLRDIETTRSWIELVGKNGFERGNVEPSGSFTLSRLLPSLERAADDVRSRLESARARTRAIEEKVATLSSAQEELEQVNYIVTHHLQEPLIRITTYLDMFGRQMRGKLDPPAARFLQSVHTGTKRIEALIEDLTLYSRSIYAPPDLYETDTGAIVRSVIESLDIEVVESGAKITVGELPFIWANPDELTKVFKHLIANAIRFRKADAPEIRVWAERGDRETIFGVADNGIGIDPGYQPQLFSVYERVHTDPAYVGSGIGLAVCKKVVEHHGGKISVASSLGEGATFRFSIPDRRGTPSHSTPLERRVH